MKTLHARSLGYAAAILSALLMFILGILGNLGFYEGAVGMMQIWHTSFSLSVTGIILGMIEAAVTSFITIYIFAIIYNSFLPKK